MDWGFCFALSFFWLLFPFKREFMAILVMTRQEPVIFNDQPEISEGGTAFIGMSDEWG